MNEFDETAVAEAYNRGLALEKAGDREGAAKAYRRALALDPDDHGGVSVRLAAMGLGATPEKMPDAYVATLFDQHADDFDDILVERLRYCVPMQLRELLCGKGERRLGRVLDLGCGTGLTGVALRDRADHITGVDLSERIVELAFDREVYDDLYVGEAVEFLEDFEDDDGGRPRWDLIVATDVFPYLGAIEPIISAAADRLEPGGRFGFSTETLPEPAFAGQRYVVGPRQRFAHSEPYLRSVLEAYGFALTAVQQITVRLEDGDPVPGHLVLAYRAG
ncbi:methyltransferase domain-containing protein [Nitratireductor sp. XY-223]|uniref:methyltransferase domain-containing protein n=1 Tax=Nitratireductor sp. XY-223 TaxID=2561926 RepID=UPI001FEEC2CC|nr:methyltransferase domain-containing protein [Nitratireductor sp. XY-223]